MIDETPKSYDTAKMHGKCTELRDIASDLPGGAHERARSTWQAFDEALESFIDVCELVDREHATMAGLAKKLEAAGVTPELAKTPFDDVIKGLAGKLQFHDYSRVSGKKQPTGAVKWDVLRKTGASDEQIAKNLLHCDGYDRGRGYSIARGTGSRQMWIGEKLVLRRSSYDGPKGPVLLDGEKLVNAARRLLDIPTPQEVKKKSPPPPKKPAAKSKPAAKKKPARGPTHKQAVAEIKARDAKKEEAAGVGFRPQTIGQWWATAKETNPTLKLHKDLTSAHPLVVELFKQKVLPSVAGRELLQDFAEEPPATVTPGDAFAKGKAAAIAGPPKAKVANEDTPGFAAKPAQSWGKWSKRFETAIGGVKVADMNEVHAGRVKALYESGQTPSLAAAAFVAASPAPVAAVTVARPEEKPSIAHPDDPAAQAEDDVEQLRLDQFVDAQGRGTPAFTREQLKRAYTYDSLHKDSVKEVLLDHLGNGWIVTGIVEAAGGERERYVLVGASPGDKFAGPTWTYEQAKARTAKGRPVSLTRRRVYDKRGDEWIILDTALYTRDLTFEPDDPVQPAAKPARKPAFADA